MTSGHCFPILSAHYINITKNNNNNKQTKNVKQNNNKKSNNNNTKTNTQETSSLPGVGLSFKLFKYKKVGKGTRDRHPVPKKVVIVCLFVFVLLCCYPELYVRLFFCHTGGSRWKSDVPTLFGGGDKTKNKFCHFFPVVSRFSMFSDVTWTFRLIWPSHRPYI